ncbi:uncharacterized protein SOCE26_099040 [Sorangium cellulosum]|uniref:Uncharacterized protein n=1 Tax=Sorangium cellulosum TaxID=56 RepID=A0A2L0F9X1_SORCE|nr:hypothetical protein [Sorangium cellulosum]AUX48370.1 uncharacterized protein SOCE26_099040 [Sorangium cellulosum]
MPQKPAVRAKKKRRDTKRLASWRAKKELASAQQTPAAGSAEGAQPRS